MNSFACYRMPYADEYVRVEQHDGEPCRLTSAMDLEGREGFVFAPFVVTDDCPLLLIRPDRVTCVKVAPLDSGMKDEGRRMKEDESMFNVQSSTFNVQRSMFIAQSSIFNVLVFLHIQSEGEGAEFDAAVL